MATKKLTEIQYKIMLRDVHDKLQLANNHYEDYRLTNEHHKLLSEASKLYPHINWRDEQSYNDTEIQSVAKMKNINLN